MTSLYMFVAPERQNELTRRVQQKLADAAKQPEEKQPVPEIVSPTPPTPEAPPSLAEILSVI